jgi:hypothetical protein
MLLSFVVLAWSDVSGGKDVFDGLKRWRMHHIARLEEGSVVNLRGSLVQGLSVNTRHGSWFSGIEVLRGVVLLA